MLTRRTLFRLLAFAPLVVRRFLVPREEHRAVLLATNVAGYRFHGGPRSERALREGGMLVLRREPHNVHDARAIAVEHPSGVRLGYLPRRQNEIPARLLDQGVALRVEIARITPPPAPPWERLTITVLLP